MAELPKVMEYLVAHYPHKAELSKARLTKMVYLADWKSALDRGCQMTDIEWRFHHFGPYVEDVYKAALTNPNFEVVSELNAFGKPKDRIGLVAAANPAELSEEDRRILDHVIAETQRLSWDAFIKLVYSTYPVLTGVRGAKLDLLESAEAYRDIGASLAETA